MKSTGGDQLLRELGTLRPIGVLLVIADPQLAAHKPWMRALEHKIMFEGLRVVVAVNHEGGSPVRIFSSRPRGLLPLTHCLGVRDLLVYDSQITARDVDLMIDRIRFAFGLSTVQPFHNYFRLTAAYEEPIEISVPGRISHMEDSHHLVVESGVFLNEGSRLTVRLMGHGGTDAAEVGATALENLPSGLRFNFGNRLRLRIDDEGLSILQDLVRSEEPGKIMDRPIRRAMVVTRSLALRQRIMSALALWQIESRVPLVRRNIRGDLPPLHPDFLIVEPAVLSGRDAVEGAAELDEYLQLAGPRCRLVVVGRRSDWNFSPSDGFSVLRESASLEDELRELVDTGDPEVSVPPIAGLSKAARRWFALDAPSAKVFLVLQENSTALSEMGFEIESSQIFRLWNNLEVRGLESKVHLVGRVSRVLRIEDAFRNVLHLGARDRPLYRCQVVSLAASAHWPSHFRALLAAHQEALPAAYFQGATDSALAPGGGGEASALDKARGVSVQRARHLAIRPDRAEDFGRGRAEAMQGRSLRVASRHKGLWLMLASVIVLVILVALAVFFDASEKVYRDSFKKLFDITGSREGL